jgi:hypothetical protein
VVKIPATGIKFINGISNKYDETFPQQLTNIVDREKYTAYL